MRNPLVTRTRTALEMDHAHYPAGLLTATVTETALETDHAHYPAGLLTATVTEIALETDPVYPLLQESNCNTYNRINCP
ncbi:hypothetical protein EO95_18355 [Methanosarcina sp. 1.H.T.1A.1]|nr:hypothetical protein EO93_09105 [Methanosarcina sp. 1.H.A.2.2]KKH93903.1 hypothetical protein EO95_18355 [Methanosarcina sp. 1.H.T.1A.1]